MNEDDLFEIYREVRDQGLSHEDAVAYVQEVARRASPDAATSGEPQAEGGDTNLGLSFLHGATVGTIDEAAGFGAGRRLERPEPEPEPDKTPTYALPPSAFRLRQVEDPSLPSREEQVEQTRQTLQRTREERPVGSALAEFGGAVLPALLTMGQSAPASAGIVGRTLARPDVGGSLEAAAAGAGQAEGGAKERAVGALKGFGTGLATAKGLKLLGTGARLFASPLLDLIRPRGDASSAVGQAVTRLSPIQSAQDRATGKVANALRRADVDVAEVVEEAGPGETLMDVGGRSTRNLAEAAASIPSRGADEIAETLDDRAAAAPTRIKEALQEKTGLTFEDAVATVEELAERKARNAAPLYDAAYQKSVPASVLSDVLDEEDAFRAAYQTGARLARRRGIEVPPVSAIRSGEVDEVPVAAVDFMKRGMDDVIDRRFRGGGLGRTEARDLRKLLRGVLEETDELVDEYAAARAQYAGDAAVLEAFEEGIEDFTGGARTSADPRAVSRRLDDMTPSERDFYRRGALDAIRRDVETVSDFGRNPDATRRVVGNEEMRQRVRQLFDDEADFDAFMDIMEREQNMVSTRRAVLSGSRTTPLAERIADLRGPEFSAEAISSPRAAGMRLLANQANARARAGTERVVDEMAPLLTAPLSSGGGTLLERLARFNRGQARRRGFRDVLTGAAAITAGGAAGGHR